MDDGRPYSRRVLPYSQARGYWTPTAFIKHVAGVQFGGRRRPEDVPPLRSEFWLSFELPSPSHDTSPGAGLVRVRLRGVAV